MAVVLPPILRSTGNSDGSRGELTLLGAMNSQRISEEGEEAEAEEEEGELSFLAILLAVLRKYLARCMSLRPTGVSPMEIGCPTDVRHVAHVTFDRFHGFLGLPVEFEPEVPRRAPSASTNVFGVSAESMQCSLDSRGNSVPTILLLMQRRLYQQGGLRAEGIFRITAENSQEEHVRDQLNNGIILDGVDVHCLAGLIKAWFRELPSGVLDHLEPEVLLRCQSEEECARLIKLLPPTQAALLVWAINLMADVVQEKQLNKMNARNIAVVFAPNMTQIADPLTAVLHVVRVMNFLKMLIARTVREREEAASDYATVASPRPRDDDDGDAEQASAIVDPCDRSVAESEEAARGSKPSLDEEWKGRAGVLRNLNVERGGRGSKARSSGGLVEKLKGTSIMNNIDSRAEREAERVEVWR